MALRGLLSIILFACTLAGCGGSNDTTPKPAPAEPTRLLAGIQVDAPIIFSGVRADYTIRNNGAGGFDVASREAHTSVAVSKTARLRFDDQSVTLDVWRNSGQVYRLYQAAFNRVPDQAGLGYWINAMDNGSTLNEIASGFVKSDEFKAVYGTSQNNTAIVNAYFLNALHRSGDAAGIAYWLDHLEKRQVDQATMLVNFSESSENQLAVIYVIQYGISYLEPGVAYLPLARIDAVRNVSTGATVTLDGAGSSSSAGKALSYRWTLVTRPAGSAASLSQGNTEHPTFVADKDGFYQAQLVVNDGRDSAPVHVDVATEWHAPASEVPATGNYVYLQSDKGDYMGGGRNYRYSSADAVMEVTANGGVLSVSVSGEQKWQADFAPKKSPSRLTPGYYADLLYYQPAEPARGGLSWSGEGRGCGSLSSFYIDKVTYSGDTLTAVDLRFEQHCNDQAAALRGQIHWRSDAASDIPGPLVPIPATLWQPPAGATPANGSYIYLSGILTPVIGQQNYLYSPADTDMAVEADGARLHVEIKGKLIWGFDFVGMHTLKRLEPGYYGDLSSFPFHNPVKGGMSWNGGGNGCNTLMGWFAVDSVTYDGLTLKAIDLRFESRCESVEWPPMRGKIHWISRAR